MVGRKTEKTRFRRSGQKLKALMQVQMHYPIREQVKGINQFLRGHYAYYGLGGNLKALIRIYHCTERRWRKMLSRRSQKSYVTWEKFNKLKELYPILKPSLSVPYTRMQRLAVL
ncbi:MAG: group II intron maturase-specific domain-containing protein [Waddliaceae bacterium]